MTELNWHLSSDYEIEHGAAQLREPCGYSVGIINRKRGGSRRYAISSVHILSEKRARHNICQIAEIALTRDEIPGCMDLLPGDTAAYYMYEGSVTAPPCTEGVTWFVLKKPITVLPAQISAFAKLYPDDVRRP